jgi:hypothetical protein
MRLIIALGNSQNVDGLHSIEGTPPPSYYSMHVTGLLRAAKGQTISVAIESRDTGAWVAQVRSFICPTSTEMPASILPRRH